MYSGKAKAKPIHALYVMSWRDSLSVMANAILERIFTTSTLNPAYYCFRILYKNVGRGLDSAAYGARDGGSMYLPDCVPAHHYHAQQNT